MPDSYYNTNREKGATLAKSNAKAGTQEDQILEFFQRLGYEVHKAPHQVRLAIFPLKTPITSVRRGMTNLSKAGKLEKTDNMTMGPWGKMVHTWKLPAPKNGGEQLSVFGKG